jgi:hypothetical protein
MTTLFVIYSILVFATLIWHLFEYSTFFEAFKRQYPQETDLMFPRIYHVAFPTKYSPVAKFFLSPKSVEFLVRRKDLRLLAKRRRYRASLLLSLVVPIGGFVLLLVGLAIAR